jgi:F0F1-type ATP synthase assembly protein I
MGLSDRERKLLEELEKSLGAPDEKHPKTPLSATELGPRRMLAGILVAVAGLGVLVFAAVSRVSPLGLAGFLIMGAGILVASSRRKSN